MNLMNAFRNIVTPTPAQPSQPQTTMNGVPVQAPQMNSSANPTVPNLPQVTAQEQPIQTAQDPQKSPSEQLAALWKIEPPKDSATALSAPTLNFDPAKVQQLSQGMDFTKGTMTQDDLAKVIAGGPEAVGVMMQAINKASQNVFAQATLANARVVQGSLDASVANLQSALPNLVRTQNMQEAIVSSNPVFTDPAVAPLLQTLKQQLIQAYPNATSSEIQAHANAAVINLGKIVGGQETQRAKAASAQQDDSVKDWFSYLTS